MAAPSGTVWGSVVGSYGKIGIYTSISSNNTTTSVTVEIWFASKYSVSDTNNNLYFDNLASSGSASTNKGSVSIRTTVDSGGGWSSSNQKKLASYSFSYTRGTAAVTRYLYARLDGVDRVGGKMYASTTISIPKLASYTIAYNANGGSGAPSSQTKYYGKNITLSSTKPTRTGYTFKGWGTSSGDATVNYAAGATYSENAGITLYAIWSANTYTVSYNANGGSGAPGNQAKTYGKDLTLSSTKPTRTNYNFKGWGTSASATTVSYAAGAKYTANAAITLYAIWEIAYIKPRITGFTTVRCDADGNSTEEGTYVKVGFSWATDKEITSIKIEWKNSSESDWSSASVTGSGTSGSVSQIVGNGAVDTEVAYTFQVTVADGSGSNTASRTVNSTLFPIDVLSGGNGVSFGKVADLAEYADFNFKAKLRQRAESIYTDVALVHEHPTTGCKVGYGVGEGGYNRGIYDYVLNAWLVYADQNGDVRVNARGITQLSLTNNGYAYLRKTDGSVGSHLFLGKYGAGIYEDPGSSYGKVNFRYQTSSGSSWSYTNVADIMANNTLWSGAYHMDADQTVTLNSGISGQTNGVVLIWSYYDNANSAAKNQDFMTVFVPKKFVNLYNGCGIWCTSARQAMSKYVYIANTTIKGHVNNTTTTDVNGVKRTNNLNFVLRSVIGV